MAKQDRDELKYSDSDAWFDAVRDVQPIENRTDRPRRKPKTTNSISAIDEDVLDTMR